MAKGKGLPKDPRLLNELLDTEVAKVTGTTPWIRCFEPGCRRRTRNVERRGWTPRGGRWYCEVHG